jgi:hypothetical protein
MAHYHHDIRTVVNAYSHKIWSFLACYCGHIVITHSWKSLENGSPVCENQGLTTKPPFRNVKHGLVPEVDEDGRHSYPADGIGVCSFTIK